MPARALTRLLLRLYDPDAGTIWLNGTDIRHLDVSDLREHLSVLHQRPASMRGTIAANIRFGCTTATRAAIAAAARAAEFISRTNGGPDAEVVGCGENLSGGQRQRIPLARTILRNRPALVLDEPTTVLDDAIVSGVLEPLAGVASLRTTMLVTHDPRVLELADRTVELRDGRFTYTAPVAPRSGEGALVERPRTVQLVLPVQP
ncbi:MULTISPECIES: ATP-binding cassette domain-containing protein [unclassified Gordonia (in: high G+C Gram-positive bacteria)]|uniref:ATP-binding cassette domain-containing protein n=1 Tax=unclassified Gordonia (in: high G+C Gram-positive bacteria) TaxID=2657482 RepID=UPI0027DBD1ED|nr:MULTISPECIES: ATP-binding cassette domain-containing protein [unclassified Gordonia (in: high G+C Gram-positive bacteria)]